MTFVLRRESRLFGLMITASMLMGVAGCSDVRRAIGTEKSTPDEFQVVVAFEALLNSVLIYEK